MYCQVVLRSATRTFDREYTYAVPGILQEKLAVGSRVLVPFGSGNRLVEGLSRQCSVTTGRNFTSSRLPNCLPNDLRFYRNNSSLPPKCGTAIFAPTAML